MLAEQLRQDMMHGKRLVPTVLPSARLFSEPALLAAVEASYKTLYDQGVDFSLPLTRGGHDMSIRQQYLTILDADQDKHDFAAFQSPPFSTCVASAFCTVANNFSHPHLEPASCAELVQHFGLGVVKHWQVLLCCCCCR